MKSLQFLGLLPKTVPRRFLLCLYLITLLMVRESFGEVSVADCVETAIDTTVESLSNLDRIPTGELVIRNYQVSECMEMDSIRQNEIIFAKLTGMRIIYAEAVILRFSGFISRHNLGKQFAAEERISGSKDFTRLDEAFKKLGIPVIGFPPKTTPTQNTFRPTVITPATVSPGTVAAFTKQQVSCDSITNGKSVVMIDPAGNFGTAWNERVDDLKAQGYKTCPHFPVGTATASATVICEVQIKKEQKYLGTETGTLETLFPGEKVSILDTKTGIVEVQTNRNNRGWAFRRCFREPFLQRHPECKHYADQPKYAWPTSCVEAARP